ncbi:hypothetical protein [Paraglaciecola arctica]|uniref:hypothetical protein n=1 Tax=Paraglaciecola arctica TaxID=1128911 RepID=UPI001C06C7E8|nr:hypothetical protein [Paraglaciecola arctica]MBU3005732.1 hypothetical protein [Paraglaciecola arctica]
MINKKILIHIGPPKTGSSAIQRFLQQHKKLLLENSIFYPDHSLDDNGISSGNVERIYDMVNGEWVLSKSKIVSLLNEFQMSEYQILLLSSEFFCKDLLQISKAIPSSQFIAYIRSPLDFLESNYNQSVKRHNNVKLIELDKLDTSVIETLDKFISVQGVERLNLRAYLPNQPGGLISDFLNALSMTYSLKTNDNIIVNSSYCHEALQVKRWLNNFRLLPSRFENEIDKTLQSFNEGTKSYSYVTSDIFESYRQESILILNKLKGKILIHNSSELIEHVKTIPHEKYKTQELTQFDVKSIAKYIYNKDKQLHSLICLKLQDIRNDDEQSKALKFISDFYINKKPHILLFFYNAIGMKITLTFFAISYKSKKKLLAFIKNKFCLDI